ncbi:cytochrome c oxidase accessory protein FixG [Rhodoblastus acidophilus]|uniref:cytochrome c oxidase accessory protein CcoG n=1 Tax=Rhodoblastus acidophilus TaxID=1074 RepID=UPI00222473D9|nr:cytochrome c oxidase accessory protein CcoG [Rhodoblastus acidophilus]MCW2282968.1 cytochrome c oxidase accessory protein FixG [Rhodoblastus acidophilus]MCW2331981.1 cytochrome c oxidase accessory protein FixG [Rhodoblastus acidophilus]
MDDDTIITGPLYEVHKKVYPQATHGTFRRIKWRLMAFTLAVYYLMPFLRWDRGPNLPDQAVLIDMPARRFYFFFIEIWPQEVYYFTGLLVIAAMTLFLLNALAGRVWCGYLCWQTVWTDLFFAVERFVEGDRRERIMKDKKGLTFSRVRELVTKHVLWLLIALFTGGAFVLYFADAPTLLKELVTGAAPGVAYIWIGILTFTTYVFAGHMREQVCVFMCPWPRIQAAMTDEWALNVSYERTRGEPRMSVKKAQAAHERGEKAGDCIDCHQCVAVCPTGVDIRNGSQLGCIQCGLCIDACNIVMKEIGRPGNLVAYDTDINIARRDEGLPPVYKLIRARTLVYPVIILLVAGVMALKLGTRSDLFVNVLHDRNPLAVTMSDGAVRNGYTVRVLNKQPNDRKVELSVEGSPNLQLQIIDDKAGRTATVGPDQTLELRVSVMAPAGSVPDKSVDVLFTVKDETGATTATHKDHFFPR